MSGSALVSTPPKAPTAAAPQDEEARRAFRFGDLARYPFKKRLAIRAISMGITGLLGALARTVKFEFEGCEHWDAARDGRLPIYAFWHDSIALATYPFRDRNIVVMTSQSFDGEYIARAIQRFGYGAARGSSTRGGVGALIEMIRLMRAGYPAAFTIDGPKGPRHVAKMGPLLLAKKTGHPVLPLAFTPSRCWTVGRSWDRTVIPKPFSRVLINFAPPITVDADADETALEAKLRELQGNLDALERHGQLWREELNARQKSPQLQVSEAGREVAV